MENRIKECQLDLYADRTSSATMRANQLRLWFASMAYVLLCALRRIGLHHTRFDNASCGTIRLKLMKIGALVRISVRRIKIAMASGCPAAAIWGEPPPVVSMPRRARAVRRPDTRRRGACATRHHLQAHRDQFFAAPAARNVPAPPAPSGATQWRACATKTKSSRNLRKSRKDTVRNAG